MSQPCKDKPVSLWWSPIELMGKEEWDAFDSSQVVQLFGEVGARGMQRLSVIQVDLQSECGGREIVNLILNDWVDVQDERYRYHAIDHTDAITIKIIIGEYLACEVVWAC